MCEIYYRISELFKGVCVGIVGVGLSGIELVSELCESWLDLEILLYDRGFWILRNFLEKLSKYIFNWFFKYNVIVVFNLVIDRVEFGKIYNNGKLENIDLVVWIVGI